MCQILRCEQPEKGTENPDSIPCTHDRSYGYAKACMHKFQIIDSNSFHYLEIKPYTSLQNEGSED